MIIPSHIFVLSEPKFVESQLRNLFCGCGLSADRQSCSRGLGLGRR